MNMTCLKEHELFSLFSIIDTAFISVVKLRGTIL